MYLTHFGLGEHPFSLTPNTRFYFNSSTAQAALNVLSVALNTGEGFVKITGEVGTGKTVLCRNLLNLLDPKVCVTAFLPNPSLLTSEGVFRALADELAIPLETDVAPHRVIRAITRRLLELAGEGKRVVLLVDEAQTLPEEGLEGLRLLSNLETENRKLLQWVLFGQPELDLRLENPSLRQLRQRITFSFRLSPMSREEMNQYLAHRLLVAGHRGAPLFSHAALNALHRASGGILRLVNILCHKAMMAAYGEGARQILPVHIARAVADTESVSSDRKRPFWRPDALWRAALSLGMAAAAVMLIIHAQGWRESMLP